MKIAAILLLFVLLGGFAGWTHQSASSDWQTIDVNGLFTFPATLNIAREIFKSITLPLPPPERSPF
jgi:hypothetical protein